MPSKNIVKEYLPESFYHIYNRGVNKQVIYEDDEDYLVFLNLLKRYLSNESIKDIRGREYRQLYDSIELLAFCLMPNHFHLLIYQYEERAMTDLLRALCTSYTTYYNKKYKRVGPLFQSCFKASYISSDRYLLHISRYIHLNPQKYKEWEYSSLAYYLGYKQASWMRPKRILELFEGEDYATFVGDYKAHKAYLEAIKSELAEDE